MKWDQGSGKEWEQPPVGTEIGTLVKIVDLGTQEGEYAGKPISRRQVILTWELPGALMTEGDYAGQPFLVSAWLTQSLNEKAKLRHWLESWRGREFTPQELMGFEARNILGKSCLLSLTANDKGKVRVSGVMALPKGTKVPKPINKLVFFSMQHGEFDQAVFESLSAKVQELIKGTPEYSAATRPAKPNGKKPVPETVHGDPDDPPWIDDEPPVDVSDHDVPF